MVFAQLGLFDLERFLEQRQGLVQLVGGLVAHGEVVHADERVGVVRTQVRLSQLERLFVQGQGQVELAGSPIDRHSVVVSENAAIYWQV